MSQLLGIQTDKYFFISDNVQLLLKKRCRVEVEGGCEVEDMIQSLSISLLAKEKQH